MAERRGPHRRGGSRAAVRTPLQRLRNTAPRASTRTRARAVDDVVAAAPAEGGDPEGGKDGAARQPEKGVEPEEVGARRRRRRRCWVWRGRGRPSRAAPRKNPTTPAMTATIVATIQVLVMKLANIAPSSLEVGRWSQPGGLGLIVGSETMTWTSAVPGEGSNGEAGDR